MVAGLHSRLIRVKSGIAGTGTIDGKYDRHYGVDRGRTCLKKLQSELAHVARLTTMGELAASIAHEINQPLGAIVNNGNLCLRLMANKSAGYPGDARGLFQTS